MYRISLYKMHNPHTPASVLTHSRQRHRRTTPGHGHTGDSQVGGAETEHGAVWDDGPGASSQHIISLCLLLALGLAFHVHITT